MKEIQKVTLPTRDLDIKTVLPIMIDNVIVTIENESHRLYLPTQMGKESYKRWNKGPGGLFSRDLHYMNTGRTSGKYVTFNDHETVTILRLVSEDEVETFESLDLLHLKVGNFLATIIKTYKKGQKLHLADEYIEENNEDHPLEVIHINHNNNVENEDDEDYGRTQSVSLFDD
jgi:hypothetical protein